MAYGYTPQAVKAMGARYNAMAARYNVRPAAGGGSYYPGKPPLDPAPDDPRYPDAPRPGTPAAPGPSGPSGPSGGGNYYYNWENDPFLMQTRALVAKSRTEAEANKNDQLRKAILSSGLDSLASSLFKDDTAFIESVRGNPFSGMGEIRNRYEGVTGKINQTNEALNQDNLFFSSYRTGVALPAVYRERQGDEYDLTNQTQSAIDSVNAAYANRLEQLQMQELQAQQEAWLRAMQMGAYSGGGPSSGDNGAGLTGRPGEWADLPVIEGWNPVRNSDARYDMSGAQRQSDGTYVGPQGARYDENGRRI